MPKSADAFRTISEVANWLETPAHVLRFWESKFSQVKPVKRAGGRRYYRPADMLLLGGIKKLLHDDGMTIKGVQKILREHGVKHVSDMSQSLEEGLDTDELSSGITLDAEPDIPESATVLNFKSSPPKTSDPASEPEDVPEPSLEDSPAPIPEDAPEPTPEDVPEPTPESVVQSPEAPPSQPDQAPDTLAADAQDELPVVTDPDTEDTGLSQAPDTLAGGAPDGVEDTVRNALAETQTPVPEPETPEGGTVADSDQAEAASDAPMPSFLRHREAEADSPPNMPPDTDTATPDVEEEEKAEAPAPEPAPAPAQIEVPEDPGDDRAADPGFLSQLTAHKTPLDPALAKELAPLVERLRALRDGTRPAG
jgi:DNA-binding transcriptional MerR regulator